MKDLKNTIINFGASMVGFADISDFPPESRENLPNAISMGIALDHYIVDSIMTGPHLDYSQEYIDVNAKLKKLTDNVIEYLTSLGHKAIPQVKNPAISTGEYNYNPVLISHKAVAATAGLGWIGKNTLLITKEFGSAVRLATVITDAPIETNKAEYKCNCKSCTVCSDACPGHAIKNVLWDLEKEREDLIDPIVCYDIHIKRGVLIDAGDDGTCGVCISACPHTRKYLSNFIT